jgi:NTE family protein
MKEYSLLLSGGGTNGVVYVGVFRKLRELNISIKKLLGVSIGSIFGLVYILNYSNEEIYDILINTDFNMFKKNIKFSNLINNYGINSFNTIKEWIQTLIENKGVDKNITFDNLFKITTIHYQVTAANLCTNQITIFDHVLTPNIRVTDAIRMSCCVPFIFIPMKYNGDIHVDGGLIDSFPLELFKEDLPNVIAIKIQNEHVIKKDIDNIIDYSQNILNSLLRTRSNKVDYYKDYNCIYTIEIPRNNFIDFDMGLEQKEALVQLGYDSLKIT